MWKKKKTHLDVLFYKDWYDGRFFPRGKKNKKGIHEALNKKCVGTYEKNICVCLQVPESNLKFRIFFLSRSMWYQDPESSLPLPQPQAQA